MNIGEKLGPYTLLEEIGNGGMATIYRARQDTVDRDVAIKVILKDIQNDVLMLQRFQREAKLIARLEHPHILPVYDFDGSYTPPYIVMRYLDGGNLKETSKIKALPHQEVAYLFWQICSALDYSHRQGIVHRDIKPSNIMIDREGNAFVTDFGIARLINHTVKKVSVTETGAVIGTADYMSPEQAMGQDDIDQRTDIYALGIMLFELLTGKLPYISESAVHTLFMHVKDPIPSILTINPNLPHEVESIIERTIAKDRNHRYQSALELSNQLTRVFGTTVNTKPIVLRDAATTSITRRLSLKERSASQITPSEQNKRVVALSANFAEFITIVNEIEKPISARKIVETLTSQFSDTMQKHGGKIFQQSETEILALWGTERSSEDDAEQALYAALHLQEVMQLVGERFLVGDDEPLPINIAVHSGLVLLSLPTGTQSLTISGTPIALLNRLVQGANGKILITYEIFQQVLGVFDIQPDEPLKIRGRLETIATYRVLLAKPRAFRLKPRGIEGVSTDMVGRRGELEQLQKRFFIAFEDNESQVTTIIGEAGLGKSRLLYEFDKWAELRPEHYRIFLGYTTKAMVNRPYALIRNLITFRFEITDNMPLPLVMEKMEKGFEELIGKNDEMAHVIGYLCGFDFSESIYIKGILNDPQQLANRGQQLFIRFFRTLSQNEPILMELEDIHYADDASLDLLSNLFTNNVDLRLVVVASARPSFFHRRPNWGKGEKSFHQISLKPLDKRDSRDLVRELLQKVSEVPIHLRDSLVERAEGNPYFIEELVKMMLEDRVIMREAEDHWHVEMSRFNSLKIPSTLLSLLETRLDTLLYLEKLTLQRASVMGRSFFHLALESMDGIDEIHVVDLPSILQKLVERDFIVRRDTSSLEGQQEYLFSENTMHDTIYQTLTPKQIITYHHHIAGWLQQIDQSRVDEYQMQIADHLEKAGDHLHAAQILFQAAKKAKDISAYSEALRLFDKVKNLLSEISPNKDLNEFVAKIAFEKSNILHDLGQFKSTVDEMQEVLSHLVDKQSKLEAEIQLLMARSFDRLGEFSQSQERINTALVIAQQLGDDELIAKTNLLQGDLCISLNQNSKAQNCLQDALAFFQRNGDTTMQITCLNLLGITFLGLSIFDSALKNYKMSIEIAETVGNRTAQMNGLMNIGDVYRILGRLDEAEQYIKDSLQIGIEIDIYDLYIIQSNLGLIAIAKQEWSAARNSLSMSLQGALNLSRVPDIILGITLFAQLEAFQGHTKRALELLGMAINHSSANSNTRNAYENEILPVLRQTLSEEEIQQGLEYGKSLDFDLTVKSLLEDKTE